MSLRRRTLMLATGLAGLGACSRREPSGLTVAMWAVLPVELEAMHDGIRAYEGRTGRRVQLNIITDKYMDVLRSRFASRKTPDVFYLDAYEAPFLVQSGVLQPFDPAQDRLDDVYPQYLDAFRGRDGRVYGIPKDCSTLALYVNTALLKRLGLKLADIPREHEDLLAWVSKLQPRMPAGHAAFIYERDLARHLSAIEAYGEPVVDANGLARLADNRGAVRYLEAFVAARRAGAILSPKDDLGYDSPGAAFGSGRVLLMMEGNWALGSLGQDFPDVRFATLEMPTIQGRRHTMAYTVGYAVSRYAADAQAGFAFARQMTGEGMVPWTRKVGFLPTRPSVARQLAPEFGAPMQAHLAGAAYATVWARGLGLPIINTNFGNEFQAALNGSKPVRAALAAAEAASNREIERQR